MNLAITVRFGKKDGDLMRMAAQYRVSDMLVLAVDRHLGKTTESIPLPPNVPYKQIHCATIYLTDEHEDAINFFRQFPNGYRSAAVKLLLRHAMERCDLRHLLEPEQMTPSKTISQPSHSTYIVPAKQRSSGKHRPGRSENKISRPAIQPDASAVETTEDIFDLI